MVLMCFRGRCLCYTLVSMCWLFVVWRRGYGMVLLLLVVVFVVGGCDCIIWWVSAVWFDLGLRCGLVLWVCCCFIYSGGSVVSYWLFCCLL